MGHINSDAINSDLHNMFMQEARNGLSALGEMPDKLFEAVVERLDKETRLEYFKVNVFSGDLEEMLTDPAETEAEKYRCVLGIMASHFRNVHVGVLCYRGNDIFVVYDKDNSLVAAYTNLDELHMFMHGFESGVRAAEARDNDR
jgi:hypothetical protein